MFPFMNKKRRNPFGFPDFDDFGMDFDKIEEEMQRMMQEAQKGGKFAQNSPFVYGFSMRVGPDGKPVVNEFGNVPRTNAQGKPRELEEREPLVDVINKPKEVSVIVELPGVDKHDIKLEAKGETLSVRVGTKARKYAKDIALHTKVKPESAKATYKNGVLEVTLDKIAPNVEKKREIKVE